jgi:hypothetical protein
VRGRGYLAPEPYHLSCQYVKIFPATATVRVEGQTLVLVTHAPLVAKDTNRTLFAGRASDARGATFRGNLLGSRAANPLSIFGIW